MTNREKYFQRRNEYDLMLDIEKNLRACPIRAIVGIEHDEKIRRCVIHALVCDIGCEDCVQDWLNEEAANGA